MSFDDILLTGLQIFLFIIYILLVQALVSVYYSYKYNESYQKMGCQSFMILYQYKIMSLSIFIGLISFYVLSLIHNIAFSDPDYVLRANINILTDYLMVLFTLVGFYVFIVVLFFLNSYDNIRVEYYILNDIYKSFHKNKKSINHWFIAGCLGFIILYYLK